METKPSVNQLLDNLSESLRASRRAEFLLQLSQVDEAAFIPSPRPAEGLSVPQTMAEVV